jgi:DHA1 family multidrug resistance protein-like MFS transporter
VNWKRNLFFIWLAQFFSIAGFGFALPFIPFYIQQFGVEDHATRNMWVAYFAAAGNFSFCIFSPIWGFLADIYGRRIMVLRANFVCALLMPAMAFVPSLAWLIGVRFLVGAFSGTVTASQTLISGNTPLKNRGFALGTLSSALYSGSMAGTFLGGFIVDHFGYRNAFLLSGFTLVIAGLLVLFGVKEEFHRVSSFKQEMKKFNFKLPAFGSIWLLLLLIMLMGLARQFDAPFLPVLVEKINGPDKAATWTGIIASISAAAGILAGSLLGWLADRTSARNVAVWAALAAGLLMLPQAMATCLWVLAGARFGMVFFAGGLDPVFQIWLAKTTPDAQRGLFFGWASSAKTLGWALGAMISGGIAIYFDVRWVFFTTGALFLMLIPLIYYTTGKIGKGKEENAL